MPTSLSLPLKSADDLFEKLKRDATLLDSEVTTDRFFNFVITGYSLIDWVKADPAMATVEVESLYANRWLKICGDLATAGKHFELSRRLPITIEASSSQGYGCGRYGRGGYGTGEEQIQIKLNDGTVINCLDFVREVVAFWAMVFSNI
ncbi:hypothetical protein [Edaphobacter sp.]|uniref:hypothetical protein n=1 Tax=Edaphobacter sp. TaxID=1934404 RepID=UPI002DBA1786|nr:hypothetical protein [Edaphobacter sp.]HEU5341666.1 hypothetical protein [Edaphobacter sp.]